MLGFKGWGFFFPRSEEKPNFPSGGGFSATTQFLTIILGMPAGLLALAMEMKYGSPARHSYLSPDSQSQGKSKNGLENDLLGG